MRHATINLFCLALALVGIACNQGGAIPADSALPVEASGIELVTVTDDDLASIGDRESYLVDLSATDTVFRLDVTRALGDAKVRVRFADGHELSLGEVMRDDGASPRRVLTLAGDPADIDVLRRGEAAALLDEPSPEGEVAGSSEALIASGGFGSTSCGGNSFSCSPFSCSCSGDDDCNDMFCSGVCGGDAVCDETSGTICWCWRWGSYRTFSYARY